MKNEFKCTIDGQPRLKKLSYLTGSQIIKREIRYITKKHVYDCLKELPLWNEE